MCEAQGRRWGDPVCVMLKGEGGGPGVCEAQGRGSDQVCEAQGREDQMCEAQGREGQGCVKLKGERGDPVCVKLKGEGTSFSTFQN